MAGSSTIAERLKRLRKVADISARELAGLAGIFPTHVSLIESGLRVERVQARTVERLARVFGVSIDWLYAGKGKAPRDADVAGAVGAARRSTARTGTEG